MIKKIALIFTFAGLILAAQVIYAQDKITSKPQDVSASTEVVMIKPVDFPDKAGDIVGKTVEIEGLVVHVCKHGGKKMFIVGENPDIRVKITATDKVSVFEPELEGSNVVVQGIVEPMAEEDVPAEEKATQDADHANIYHKPQFSIACQSFKVLQD